MTTPNTLGLIITSLKQAKERAERTAAKSMEGFVTGNADHRATYQAGYDCGFVDALEGVLQELTGEEA